jgi:uncharacterized protein
MVVDVSAILKDYGEKITVHGSVELNEIDFLGEQFVFCAPLQLDGEIVNNGTTLEFTAMAQGQMKVHCARCNKPLDRSIQFDIHELLAQGEEEDTAEEDIVLFSGSSIDLGDIVQNSFLMNVTGKYLCKEDCKGLCPNCGKDLNDGPCGCDTEVIDPRWAALADIIKQNSDES